MILLKSMYAMTKCGKLYSDETIECLLEICFIQFKCQIYIYYKYAPYGTKSVVLSYFDDCLYWYTSEAIVKWFLDDLGNRFHVKFLGYAHRFI